MTFYQSFEQHSLVWSTTWPNSTVIMSCYNFNLLFFRRDQHTGVVRMRHRLISETQPEHSTVWSKQDKKKEIKSTIRGEQDTKINKKYVITRRFIPITTYHCNWFHFGIILKYSKKKLPFIRDRAASIVCLWVTCKFFTPYLGPVVNLMPKSQGFLHDRRYTWLLRVTKTGNGSR